MRRTLLIARLVALAALVALASCRGGTIRHLLAVVPPTDPAEPQLVVGALVVDGEGRAVEGALAFGGEYERWVELWIPAGFSGADRPDDLPAELGGGAVVRTLRDSGTRASLVRHVQPLRALAVGEVSLPEQVFRVENAEGERLEATLEAVTLRIAEPSFAEGGFDPDERTLDDNVGAVDVARDPTWLVLGAVAALFGLLGLAAWWRWWRRARPRPTAPRDAIPQPAHVRALRELARLRGQPRTTPAEVEALYVEVSAVLRRYFEERFGLRAPERTTEEFLPEVERRALLDATRQGLLGEFLAACDLVKFAGAVPLDEAKHERTLSIAQQIVEATRADAADAAAGSSSAAPAALGAVAVGGLEGFALLDPWFLAAALLPLAVWFARARRPRAAAPAATVVPLGELPRTLRQRARVLPTVLRALGIVLLAVALARPASRSLLPSETEGIDILLVLDRSSSMRAGDMVAGAEVSRMQVARERAVEFARARPNDRVGVLTFALFPELLCPLTLDQDAVASYLRAVETVDQRAVDGTAIGVALARGVQLMKESAGATRVLVLLTDGENNVPDVLPADAARFAEDEGVRIYAIGIGGPQRGPFGMVMQVDWSGLEEVAEITGGEHFVAETAEELEAVYERIDELERVPLEDPRYATVDLYAWPLAAAALCLALGLCVELLWIREVPA